MKLSIINKFKYSPFLYSCYYYIGSAIIRILSIFIKPKRNRIFFISFGGRKFDDSPKAIYDLMIKDERFENLDIIWGFQNPVKNRIPVGTKVKVDSLQYYIKLLSSSIWITNSGVERGLWIHKGNRFYINSWHGTPIKKLGSDINSRNTSFGSKGSGNVADVFMAQSDFDADIFSRIFGIPYNNIAIIGLPRNDELVVGNHEDKIQRIKEKLNIPLSKRVILYAPTFREYEKDEGLNCVLTPPLNLKKWEQELGDNYVFLLRAHYEVVKVMSVIESDFTRDVSSYPHLNELMLISDLLISDYSSIFIDFSILERPMIPYCYDYDDYSSKRGLYFDIRKELSCNIKCEDELIELISSNNYLKYKNNTILFKNNYVSTAGEATRTTLDIIYNKINNR